MSRPGGYIDIHSKIGVGREEDTRPVDEALREMDAAGVEVAWVCPPDAETAVANREGNDRLLRAVRDHPNRFIGCAVANPWYGEKAALELRRAFDFGLRALFLYPKVQGFQLTDSLVDSVVETALAHHAPIYIHTASPVSAEPFQVAALAMRFPRAAFIMGHMGYPDFWYDAIPAASSVGNVWLETSRIDGDLIAEAVKVLGAQRLVFGSDAPFCALEVETEKIASLGLPAMQMEMIMRRNAEGLLP